MNEDSRVSPMATSLELAFLLIWSCFLRLLSSSVRTACDIGIIIAVVAVLFSHMDKKHVTTMKPKMILYNGW